MPGELAFTGAVFWSVREGRVGFSGSGRLLARGGMCPGNSDRPGHTVISTAGPREGDGGARGIVLGASWGHVIPGRAKS